MPEAVHAIPSQNLVLMRAVIWAVVGMIYAPLFVALHLLFVEFGLAAWAYIPAAALAGAAGAALYGARQVAIAAGLVGIVVALGSILVFGHAIALLPLVLLAFGLGLVVGLTVRFPRLCTQHVAGKTATGLLTGALCAALLAVLEWLGQITILSSIATAFLVSANGVLYVATVRQGVRWFGCHDQQSCALKQGLVIGLVAALTAASLWVVAGAISGDADSALTHTLLQVPEAIPPALMAGAMAGAITGSLLELFGFRWVHDV